MTAPDQQAGAVATTGVAVIEQTLLIYSNATCKEEQTCCKLQGERCIEMLSLVYF